MNIRLTIALVVILAVLGGFVYFAQRGRTERAEREERPFIYKIEAESIVGIRVKYQEKEVAFARAESGWVFEDVERTPVDPDRFGGLAYLLSGPRAERELTDVADPGDYGLVTPEGTITIVSKTLLPVVLELGDMNADWTQRFMRLRGAPEIFMIHASWTDVLIRLVTEPPYPAPVALYTTAQEDITSINVTYRGQEVRLARTEAGWVFDDPSGAPADQERLASILPLLADLKAERSIASVTDMAAYGLAEPQGTVTIVDKEELTIVLELGSLSPGRTRQYARVPDGTDVFVMDIALIQALTRLVTEPPYPTPEAGVTPTPS